MKFEKKALSQYLANNLKPLTAADPNILADYVVALLKNDVPAAELQKMCADRLEVFLGHSSMSFTTKLFEALQGGSLRSTNVNLDVTNSPEPSMSNATVETQDMKSFLLKEDNQPSSSEPLSDPEDKENSDDDDDRNHKHRKRDARENSFDNAIQEQPIRRLGKKRSQNFDTGQLYMEAGSQSREIQKEYSSSMDRVVPSRLERRHFVIPPSMRSSSDLNSRSRLSTSFRTDPSPRLDLSTSVCLASLGRGRGRNLAAWSQPDSRFNSLDSLDFTSHMASQRPVHPGLFVGPSLQGAGSSHNASWGAFGFIHGISNGIMDPLHPLGLQIGMPRQRCRDFEERGFCLRGDMCPMEHGVNRIVVEDVQTSIKKSDGSLEQAAKKQKINLGSRSAKDAEAGSTTISVSGESQKAGKSLERSNLTEIVVSPSSKTNLATMQQANQIVKQVNRTPAAYASRFKLDNRPTSFRVLPPLPAKLANVSVLKDHFSKFGDLAYVVFEDPEEIENSDIQDPEKIVVCVTFHTRSSAERAYQAGKYCEGCSLKFAWVTASSAAGKDCHVEEIPSNAITFKAEDDDIKTESKSSSSSSAGEPICIPMAVSSSLSAGQLTCIPRSEVDAKKTEDHGDVEGRNRTSSSVSNSLIATLDSSPTIPMHGSENHYQ